jgi:ParB family transcriptional regulator, chromosome partitioning protein
MDEIKELMISELHDFKNHPFKVEQNMELFELTRSIEQEGVIVPLLARPNPYGDGYEIIAGHRRKIASLWAGRDTVPVVVRNLDDNQAVIAMVDSNLQRENIRLSEKAYAYKMKLEAMNRQGQRTESTSVQVEPKWSVDGIRSNELLAKQIGESVAQIKRYIRLTCLIPKILDMVDEGRIAFTIAVELSYLKEEEQYELHAVMALEQCTPSLSQANRLKRMSQSGQLEMDMMYEILGEEKANQREQIKIKADSLEQYFPSDYTPKQKVELIEKLVKEWHEEQQIINKSVRSGRIR